MYIEALVEYGVGHGLIDQADRMWARNQLLAALALDSYEEPETVLRGVPLEEILGQLLDGAVERGASGSRHMTFSVFPLIWRWLRSTTAVRLSSP